MSVFITGDTHGSLDITKLKPRFFDASGLNRNDYMIILGDFAMPWTPEGINSWKNRQENYWLNWLDKRPWTTLFIDGNHENFDLLGSFPEKQWHGGRVHFVRDNIIHLMRGQVFDIDNMLFFTMGGAESIDRHMRIPGESWWEEELPDDVEMVEAMDNLASVNYEVDYVLTHEAPSKAKLELGMRLGAFMEPGLFENWLQYNIAEPLIFDRWFFGHHHVDIPEMLPYTPLYDTVLDLSLGCPSPRQHDLNEESLELPEPRFPGGYTQEELQEIAMATEEEVLDALEFTMTGSTVGIGPDGQVLYGVGDTRTRILAAL